MLLYKCFRFSEVMDQMFLTVRVPCRVLTLGVACLCLCRLTTRIRSLEMFSPPPQVFFFGVNLDYLDVSGGIFDL